MKRLSKSAIISKIIVRFFGLILAGSLGVSFSASALEYGCHFKPSQIEQIAFNWIQGHWKQLENQKKNSSEPRIELPNSLGVNASFQSPGTLDYEAFLRPRKTEALFFLGTFVVQLSREDNLVYVCLHEDVNDPDRSHLTIYFLKAYGIDPPLQGKFSLDRLANLPGNILFSPDGIFNLFGILGNKGPIKPVSVTPVSVGITPTYWLTEKPNSLVDGIPVLGSVLKVPGTALQLVGNILDTAKEKLGAGAERMVITSKYYEFSTAVNLSHPSQSLVLFHKDFSGSEKSK